MRKICHSLFESLMDGFIDLSRFVSEEVLDDEEIDKKVIDEKVLDENVLD